LSFDNSNAFGMVGGNKEVAGFGSGVGVVNAGGGVAAGI